MQNRNVVFKAIMLEEKVAEEFKKRAKKGKTTQTKYLQYLWECEYNLFHEC